MLGNNQFPRLNYEIVSKCFQDQGCELLETEYKNARTKMKYRCICGNISSIVYDSFRRGNRCKKCGINKIIKKQTGTPKKNAIFKEQINTKYVKDYFCKFNCTFFGEYVNANKKIEFLCSCGKKSKTTWSSFVKRKTKCCEQCSRKARSGENHYAWIKDRDDNEKWLEFKKNCYANLARMKGSGDDSYISENFLGYTRNQFWEVMVNHPNWKDCQGKKWHIDHIFPLQAFKDFLIFDQKLINGLDNIRPMLPRDNISKNCKYDKVEFINWLISKGIEHGKQENSS